MSDRINKDNLNRTSNADEWKKQHDLRMKKQKRKDLMTVLAILSSVFVHALLIALLKGGERMVHDITGGTMAQAREIYESTRTVFIGLGIISLILMIIFIVQCVKERNKNKHLKKDKKAFIDYDRLEMARVRVAKARMDAKKQGNKSDSKLDNRYSRLNAMEQEDMEYLEKHRQQSYHGMSQAEYQKKRQEEYERYMNMDFSEDDDYIVEHEYPFDDDSEYEEYTKLERIKNYIVEHGVIIGIVVGVAILVIMATVIIGFLL